MAKPKTKFPLALKILTPLIIVVLVSWAASDSLSQEKSEVTDVLVYEVQQGDLVIDVLEAGSVEASESQTITSKVEGRTTIISIVEEGTILTDEDVEKKRVLVELDSSELRDQETQQEITLQSAQADLTDALESKEIQVKQNESNLKAGELKTKFARMDLAKYTGEELAFLLIGSESRETDYGIENVLDDPRLAGEALQTKRELQDQVFVNELENNIAEENLLSTKNLFGKGYVSESDLKSATLAYEKSEVSLAKATSAVDLFEVYEIRKQVEQLLSDFQEAERELYRIRSKNRSVLAWSEAKLQSSSATYTRQIDRLDKIREQIENSVMIATQPGLVVYAGGDRRRSDQQIEEGAEVYERQEIIRIPNSSSMAVEAKIHESVIARVKEGLAAEVRIDAFPDRFLKGHVDKVGLLPDSQNRWYNPELKVYKTMVVIDEENPGLKPGMSARVRIIVDELNDVLMVPIHAVASQNRKNYCFVKEDANFVPREVEPGDYNDDFMEIKSGLKLGELVALDVSPMMDQLPTEDRTLDRQNRSGEPEKDKAEQTEEEESEPDPSLETSPAANQASLDTGRKSKRVDS